VKERKEPAHGEVPPVNDVALNSDEKGLSVFVDGSEHPQSSE
jgi:hypothetical protein